MPIVLLLLLFICEVSDLVDGFVARKKHIVTDFGKILDPMSDSICHLVIFFTFTQGVIRLPLLLVLIFLYREFFITTLRTLCALKGFVLAARKSGKIKTLLHACVNFSIIILMMFIKDLTVLSRISIVLVSLLAVYSVISACEYIYVNWGYIKRALSTDSNNLR
jgi:CDP-diacylglycerol--glycerol-3-phosphate 3-phosphatidyltransferase